MTPLNLKLIKTKSTSLLLKSSFGVFLVFIISLAFAQRDEEVLPIYVEDDVRYQQDWLIDATGATAALYQDQDSNLVISNGLVSRIFKKDNNMESLNFWQIASILLGIICISNGIVVTVNHPKSKMIDFAGISQVVLGVALTFSSFFISL